jgi:uncharacterized coiled-coil protein SlyX
MPIEVRQMNINSSVVASDSTEDSARIAELEARLATQKQEILDACREMVEMQLQQRRNR